MFPARRPGSAGRPWWLALGVLGVVGVAGWWFAPPVVRGVAAFLKADLADQDSYSSVVSMLVGIVSLIASVTIAWLQSRHPAAVGAARPSGPSPDTEAVQRLRAHLGRRDSLPRMGDAALSALMLRVHPSIELPPAGTAPDLTGLDPDLPTFVPRDHYPQVAQWMTQSRETGGFLLVIGNSSVGKTRLLHEAARSVLGDFHVLAPDLGDGDLINRLAASAVPLPRLVIWLDELQRFIEGPYLTSGAVPITAAAVRQLLDSPSPVVIVGTLWPEYSSHLRIHEVDDRTGKQRPTYPEAVDILDISGLKEITLQTFSTAERRATARLAVHDPRLEEAVADRDFNVTEALAGARQLVRRAESATEDQKAVLFAAIDALRLGLRPPVTTALLSAAGRGYVSGIRHGDDWAAAAIAELADRERPQDRSTAPLMPILNADRTEVVGYDVADYLLQKFMQRRSTEAVPALAWQAYIEHAQDNPTLYRLAKSANRSGRWIFAVPLFRQLSEGGAIAATIQLALLLGRQGRAKEAIAVVDAAAGRFDPPVLHGLLQTLYKQGHVEEVIAVLKSRARQGDRVAFEKVLNLLQERRRRPEARAFLRSMAQAGDQESLRRLASRLAADRRHAELLELFEREPVARMRSTTGVLRAWLNENGRSAEAEEVLRAYLRTARSPTGAGRFVAALVHDGRTGDALAFLQTLDYRATVPIDLSERFASLAADGDTEMARLIAEIDYTGAGAEPGNAAPVPAPVPHPAGAAQPIHISEVLSDVGDVDFLTTTEHVELYLAGEGEELRRRGRQGEEGAWQLYMLLLWKQGDAATLVELAEAGSRGARRRLADVLAERRDVPALRLLKATGNGRAHLVLAQIFEQEGDREGLLAEVNSGNTRAFDALTRLLRSDGDVRSAEQLRRFGLDADGAIADRDGPPS